MNKDFIKAKTSFCITILNRMNSVKVSRSIKQVVMVVDSGSGNRGWVIEY